MPNLSINLLYDAFPNPEAAAQSAFPFLDRARVDILQVTTGARKEQGRIFALQLKQRYSATNVILRLLPDENPALYQRYPNAADYVASIAPWASGGLMIGAGNEAGVSDLAAQNVWYAAVVEGLGRLGIRSATPSIQTHNRFTAAAFDATYRALAKYNGLFSLHYYADPANGLPIDPIHETVAAYCAAQGIPIQFVITELGYAAWLGAYAGYHGRITSADYAAQLVATARRWPRVRFLVYGWGKQDPWNDFDISEDQTVQDALVVHNLEAVQPPPIDRTTLGDPVLVTVTSTAANIVNIRVDTSTSAAIAGTFKTGDAITLRPTPTTAINSFQWYAVEAPVVGWSASVFKWVASAPPEDWIVNLDVPYVSQSDAQAARSRNDCGISSLLMLEHYWFTQHGLRVPLYPTVDELEVHTPLAIPGPNTPHGLNFTDIATLARATGFETQYVRPMTPDVITANLQAGKPCLCLCDYAAFNPTAGEEFAHFMIVKGFSENNFLCHDPYKGGPNYRISRTQLDAAMKLVVGNALSYQGVTLA